MTRGQIKTPIRTDLADLGVVRISDNALNDLIQEAYNDVAVLTQCIINQQTLDWIPNLSYYDFREYLPDYLCTLSIFNNVTNQFLNDDLSVRDFDKFRIDWENWIGTPINWAPCSPYIIAICAKYGGTFTSGAFNSFAFTNAYYIGSGLTVGTFDLNYAATAPILTSDSDVFLIAPDVSTLIQNYSIAECLEGEGELAKALEYWNSYYEEIEVYAKRVKNIARTDLLLRI